MKIITRCSICEEETTFISDILPNDWEHTGDTIKSDKGWCPEHKSIKKFVDTQCASCTRIWKRCVLWMYIESDTSVKCYFDSLNKGVCPIISPLVTNIDPEADEESGKAFVKFIMEKERKEWFDKNN